MKNTVKLFGIIALIGLLGFAACDNGTSPNNTTEDFTWTLEQVGGEAGANNGPAIADTTAILITFNGKVNLTDADITIGGAAERDSSRPLSSSVNKWTVPVTVNDSDDATVKITKEGIASGPKSVLVYKEGKAPPITWTYQVDGTADSVDSTKITFNFSAAVTGLTENDITLTAGTGSANKGGLTGSGITWNLAITPNTQGTISVAINKTGITKTPQTVTIHKKAVHPVSNRTSWINGTQVVFSDDTGNNGTYTLNGFDWSTEEWDSVAGEGTWTWNQSAATVTLTPTKVADWWVNYDGLITKSELETALLEQTEESVAGQIEYYMEEPAWDDEENDWITLTRTEQEAEAYFLEVENFYNGTNYTTVEEYIAGEVAKQLDEMFGARPYTYIFVDNGERLILLEALPTPVGTDELAGNTFHVGSPDFSGGYDVDETQTIVFSAGRTFTATAEQEDYINGGTITMTLIGTYSYDTTTKRVYLKAATINGVSPAQFYADAEVDEYSRYPTEADDRAAQTNQQFNVSSFTYVLAEKVLLY